MVVDDWSLASENVLFYGDGIEAVGCMLDWYREKNFFFLVACEPNCFVILVVAYIRRLDEVFVSCPVICC